MLLRRLYALCVSHAISFSAVRRLLPYLLCITLVWASHPQLLALPFTNAVTLPQQQADRKKIPIAKPVEEFNTGEPIRLEAQSQVKDGDIYTLSGNVVIHSREYVLRAQTIVYDSGSGIATVPGEFTLEGGPDQEHIRAAHGEVNVRMDTAHFYDVTGTVVVSPKSSRPVYESGSPFIFRGREVLKEGSEKYVIYDGMVTSCALPHPDWDFTIRRAALDGDTAKLYGSVFRLVHVPLFYFPYLTHATDTTGRQTGLLIPTVGTSSSKGTIIGDEVFWAMNRSTDLTLGLDYYSLRGFAERGVFHYRGNGLDFARASFSALQDRGLTLTQPIAPGAGEACTNQDASVTLNCNQGGQDVLASGRHDFTPHTRVAGDIEYLSSYIYREAFAESFALAVNSEVKSTAYITHDAGSIVATALLERYQNFEDTTPGDEIRILHVPSLEATALDHSFGPGFFWRADTSADGLRRSEPGFATGGITERVDLNPAIGWEGFFHGLSLRPWIAVRETFYSRSQLPGAFNPSVGYIVPEERAASINRSAFQAGFDLDLPPVERTFNAGGWQWRHVLEPELKYRFTGGVDNFQNILRFDETDILSDTNEVEYGLTQRLFVRHRRRKPCPKDDVTCRPDGQEAVSWFVGQKYFFQPDFGGALTPGQRNVLDTTVLFTGAAFLTGPRYQSPVVSRLQWRSTSNVDLEWDADYDPKAGQLLLSNIFANVHAGQWFGGVGNAHLIEPGEVPQSSTVTLPADFNQIRLLAGYGGPTKRGFSAAANTGYDFNLNAVQYGAIQTSYNWNCCGLSVEYRRFALGSVRNENSYRFNLTLAGVGTAGNLRRSERLF